MFSPCSRLLLPQFSEARAKYEAAIQLDSTQASFLGNLAAVSLAEHRFDDCIQECQEAFAVGEKHKTMDYSLLARLLLRIGTALFKLERFSEAIDYIQRSLLEERTSQANRLLNTVRQAQKKAEDEAYLDPVKSEEAKDRGNEHFQNGRWREAIDQYTDSIRRDPKNYKSFCNRAACWIKIMEWEKALEDCNKTIQLEPSFVKAYIRKGNVQVFLKQYHQALDTYERGLTFDANNQELLQGRMQVIQTINMENRSGEVSGITEYAVRWKWVAGGGLVCSGRWRWPVSVFRVSPDRRILLVRPLASFRSTPRGPRRP